MRTDTLETLPGTSLQHFKNRQTLCLYDIVQQTKLPQSMSADWDGFSVMFSGDWWGIPDMITNTEPTQKEIEEWAEKPENIQRQTDVCRHYYPEEFLEEAV